jgi:glycerol-3-phosphate dehydrogenase
VIERDIDKVAAVPYDLIVIGGGIYGIALLHQAACRGLRSLLVEKEDFANATSTNSLRIIHGGFRYLQNLDLHRFYESVGERRWFLENFGALARPLACLMPLYNRGLHRTWVLKPALLANDLLSWHRNRGVPGDNHLHRGHLVSARKVRQVFEMVDSNNLAGGAVWYDGTVDTPQRALMEWLKAAVRQGAKALNYAKATDLIQENGSVRGIRILDQTNGRRFDIQSGVVINAAGPWCRELAACFDRDEEALFRSSIAWNLLFDRPPLSDHALAITPPAPNAKTYFLRPWKGRLLAGTVHEPYNGEIRANPLPDPASIEDYIQKINLAIPGLQLRTDHILHLFSGLLPAKTVGSEQLAVRENIHDHGSKAGPKGLYTVSGVKFTTARLVAEKTLTLVCKKNGIKCRPDHKAISSALKVDAHIGRIPDDWHQLKNSTSRVMEDLAKIIQTEAVVHLDDLVLRRTTIGDNPRQALETAGLVCRCFDWEAEQRRAEMKRLRHAFPYVEPNLEKDKVV